MQHFPQTQAVRRALENTRDSSVMADLMFLECWETNAMPGAAAALRVTQIRRANPLLAAAVHAEISAVRQV